MRESEERLKLVLPQPRTQSLYSSGGVHFHVEWGCRSHVGYLPEEALGQNLDKLVDPRPLPCQDISMPFASSAFARATRSAEFWS